MFAHIRFLLLAWLLIAPIASNLIRFRGGSSLFQAQVEEGRYAPSHQGSAYLTADATVTLGELLDPTRILFIVALTLLLLPVLTKRRVIGLDRAEVWMLVFSTILIANVVSQSWRVAYGLRVAADAFIIPFMAYAVMRRLITTEIRFQQFSRMLGYIGFYIIIIALVERLMAQKLTYRLQGPFLSGQVLQVVLAVAFFAVWSERPRLSGLAGLKHDVRYGIRQIVLLFTGPIVFLTWSRGNWAGLVTGCCVYLFLGRRLIYPRRKFGAIGLVLTMMPAIAILAAGLEPSYVGLERISDIETVESRFATWTRLIHESTNNPIFGMGLNNLRNYLAQDWHLLATVHNCYLSMLIELGVAGLLTYLMIVVSIIRNGCGFVRMHWDSAGQWRGLAILAVVAAHQVPSLFANNLYLTELGHVLVFAFIGAVAGRYEQHRSLSTVPRGRRRVAHTAERLETAVTASSRRSAIKSQAPYESV